METNNELVVLLDKSGLEVQTSNQIKEKFLPFYTQAIEWHEKALSLIVTDASQKDKMKDARKARLILKNIRTEADKTRKLLKEDSNRYGKAVQTIYNTIEKLIEPTEEHLEKQERFIEIQEEKRLNELRSARLKEIQQYVEFIPISVDLGKLSEEDYTKLVNGAKLSLQAKNDAERERIEKEKTDSEKLEKARIENENLRKENELLKTGVKPEEVEEIISNSFQPDISDKDKILFYAKTIEEINQPIVENAIAKDILLKSKELLSRIAFNIREKTNDIK